MLRILAVVSVGAALALVGAMISPRAQSGGGALVVQTCGVLPQAFTAGSTRSLTVDVNGNTC